ncbi:hypothetical protein MBLNU230_g2719t1 [Neophaeotheca triangularis]
MPPPKRNRNPARNSQQYQATVNSEYETDNATDYNTVLPAPPPKRSITDTNMAVLRRYVPHIRAIEAIANFATVYNLAVETGQWEKYGIEGTLFVCQLDEPNGQVRYKVIILNRKSMENFVAEIKSNEDVEVTDDWVFLQVPDESAEGKTQVFGLWILEDAELGAVNTRQIVSSKIQECVVRAETARGEGPIQQEQERQVDFEGPAGQTYAPQQQTRGQQIPLHALFGHNGAPQAQQQAPHPPAPMPVQQPVQPPQFFQRQPPQPQPSQFRSTSDADFFHSLQRPASASQQPPMQPLMPQLSQSRPQSQDMPSNMPPPQVPTNQGLLLDLFRNAKQG